jgi:hypothetical protein
MSLVYRIASKPQRRRSGAVAFPRLRLVLLFDLAGHNPTEILGLFLIEENLAGAGGIIDSVAKALPPRPGQDAGAVAELAQVRSSRMVSPALTRNMSLFFAGRIDILRAAGI